jgi:heptosyltransferase II
MRILVRLPNWLGDMIMSVAFLYELQRQYPGASISVIAKKGIHALLPYFPPTEHQFIFSKEEYKGMKGLRRFGKLIRRTEQFDLFFCLPDSFSSALMGYFSGARQRIGFKKELRGFLMTNNFNKPRGLHRVYEYLSLVEQFTGVAAAFPKVVLQHNLPKKDYIVVNINSEASSRRLTVAKAVDLLDTLQKGHAETLVLVGAPKEKAFVDEVYHTLHSKQMIENKAGQTNLSSLIQLLASAKAMVTTDSGPAHLANALGTPTVVLFGAGNEKNTAPFNSDINTVVRLGMLSCEPCTKNKCVRYEVPQCLQQLDSNYISEKLNQQLSS